MPPQLDVVEEIGYEITGPGYTFYEFALTADMSLSESSTATTSTTTPIFDAEWTRTALGSPTITTTYAGITTSFPSSSSSSSNTYSSYSSPAMYDPNASATSPAAYTVVEGTAGTAGYNATSAAEGALESGTSSSSPPDGTPSNTTSSVLKGVLITIGVLALLLVFVFCIKRRRARRRSRSDPEMSQTTTNASRPVVSHAQSIDVVPLPPPLARYSRIADSAALPPALPPRTRATASAIRPPRQRYSTTSTPSTWADGSEMDAFATDGSSIARTLSTHSNDSRVSDTTVTGTAENPFDHPAYTTLIASSRRTRSTPTGTLITVSSPLDPFSDGHAASPSSSGLLDVAPSPISPVSPAVTTSRRSPADTLEDMFADMADDSDSASLSRGATIIRHVDGGSAPRGREGQPEPEHIGGGEVHIPPTYMELYPRQAVRLPR